MGEIYPSPAGRKIENLPVGELFAHWQIFNL